MTATALHSEQALKSIGLPRTAPFRSYPSPFTPDQYGLTYWPVGRMSYANRGPALYDRLRAAIKRILAENPNTKGIIHTSSFLFSDEVARVHDPRLLVQKRGDDQKELLDRHFADPRPTVLVSPSMTEGVDLKGSRGEWQVLLKVPYPHLKDVVVERKMALDPSWYAWKTVGVMCQAAGRCVRGEADRAKTYVLDACFEDLLRSGGRFFPEYWNSIEVRE
jgi:Rad3-related DNA helicase